MGTLLSQPERKSHRLDKNELEDFMYLIHLIENKYKVDKQLAIKIVEVYELRRRNELQLSDNDIKDEQLSGFGELLKELVLAIENLNEK